MISTTPYLVNSKNIRRVENMILTSSEPIMLLHVADGCEDSRWRETEDDKFFPNEGEDHEDDQEKDAAEEPCYRILPIPGKGQGMVATRKLYPGEVVMTERPLLVVPDTIFRDCSRVETFIERRINRMSCEDRDRFLGLTDCRNVMGHAYCGRYVEVCKLIHRETSSSMQIMMYK